MAEETQVETIRHNDLDALEQTCCKHPVVAYVCDGVYSMGGFALIEGLLQLQEKYGLFLYIDCAHGISLFGDNGEGFARSQLPRELGERTIVAASARLVACSCLERHIRKRRFAATQFRMRSVSRQPYRGVIKFTRFPCS